MLKGKGVWVGTFSTNLIILFAGVAGGILAARILGPSDRGLLEILLFWPHFMAGIINFGLNESIVISVSKNEHDYKRLCGTSFWLPIGIGLLFSILFIPIIPSLMGQAEKSVHGFVQLYFPIFIIFSFISSNLLALDQGNLNFRRFNILRLLAAFIYPIGLLFLWINGKVSAVTAAIVVLSGVLLSSVVRIILSGKKLFSWPSYSVGKALLNRGIRLSPANWAMALAASMDRLFLIQFGDAKTLGFYVVALTVARTAQGVLASTLTSILMPSIARESTQKVDSKKLLWVLKISSSSMVAINGMLLLLIPVLLPLLYSNDYVESIIMGQILLIAFIFVGMKQVLIYIQRAKDHHRQGVLAELLSIVIFFVLVWPMYHLWDAVGVAFALVIAHIGGWLFLTRYISREYHWSIGDWVLKKDDLRWSY